MRLRSSKSCLASFLLSQTPMNHLYSNSKVRFKCLWPIALFGLCLNFAVGQVASPSVKDLRLTEAIEKDWRVR